MDEFGQDSHAIPESLRARLQEARKYIIDACVDCKGNKLLCGLSRCPILETISIDIRAEIPRTKELFGEAPQVFIGSRTYPWVNSSNVVLPSESSVRAEIFSDPKKWLNLPLPVLLDIRFASIRGERSLRADRFKTNRFVEAMQEIALSTRPLDVEILLAKPPRPIDQVDVISSPMGPVAPALKTSIVDNPVIPRKVDSILDEENNMAHEQIAELFRHGFDVYYIQQIFSVGLTGRKGYRKLVPTRWSITAVDDTLGKELLPIITQLPENSEIRLYHNVLLDNSYWIAILPGKWAFEHFEAWLPGSIFTLGKTSWKITRDGEGFSSREQKKTKWRYSRQAGGYYAARLAVMEFLAHTLKRQATVLAIREIGPLYIVPVGVVQVRENVRKTLSGSYQTFQTKEELINFLKTRIKAPFQEYQKQSMVLSQSKLTDFFG